MTKATSTASVSRRALLSGGLAGGFLFAFHLPVRAANEPIQPPDVTEGRFAPNAFIRIEESGRTTLVMPQVEMGQGVYTSIPQIIADLALLRASATSNGMAAPIGGAVGPHTPCAPGWP